MKNSLIISLVIVISIALVVYALVFRSKMETKELVSDPLPTNTEVVSTPEVRENNQAVLPAKKNMHNVTIETNKGVIVFETYDQDAPNTVKNFVELAEKGFYDDVIFHRVIDGFMIQGGDPTGTGSGGPGYKFNDELDPNTPSGKEGYKKGVVAMANAGPNTNGSQFFIMLKDTPLPYNYTIFGRVIKGQEVVDAIGKTPTGPNDRPLDDIVMKNVTVTKI
jgi:cyclophilin family peptidyl-prolyl cis-trans isomerase